MTTFQHKTQPITISYSEYSKLSASEKQDFMIVNSAQTNNITTINNQTTDVLGLGEVATVVVATPLVIAGALLGFFD